jgi:uncharacterized protein (TIGR03437 family)
VAPKISDLQWFVSGAATTGSGQLRSYHEGMRFVLFLVTTLSVAGEFTTSLGDTYPYAISAITTDSAGNTYVVGSRALALPANASSFGVVAVSIFLSAGADVFVSKLDPNGKLLFTDTFAGNGVDTGTAITLDLSGNIYIAGTTTSSNFPLSKPLITQPGSIGGTGFIIKLSNDGTTIFYSTYFGGTLGATGISSLATDSKGNLYLTGATKAADFPHTAGMPVGPVQRGTQYNSGAIIASISAAGDKILYSGAIAAATESPFEADTGGVGIAVDAAGNAYIAGYTDNPNLPTTEGALSPNGVGAFVAKINPAGAGVGYLTYIGSGETVSGNSESPANTLSAIAVDAAGNAYLAGSSADLVTTPGALQPALSAEWEGTPGAVPFDGFLAKLNSTGSAMIWATYLPGGYGATPQSMGIDAAGNVWTSGIMQSDLLTIPNTNGWTTGYEFLVGINASGSKLSYSAWFPSYTTGQSVAIDPSGLVHVAGVNGFVSAINPTTMPTMKIFALQNAFGGDVTARLSPAEVIAIYGPGIGGANPLGAVGAPTNGYYPKTLAGVQVTVSGANIPLLYVSVNQINAVVPMGLVTGTGATIRVIVGTTVSADYPVWIAASAPQAFETVLNQDGTINSVDNPAKSGSIVTFYATGWQSSFYPLTDGQVANAALDACFGICKGATGFSILYGGAAPGIVAGVTQFNIRVNSQYASQVMLTTPFFLEQTVWVEP